LANLYSLKVNDNIFIVSAAVYNRQFHQRR